MGYTPFPRTGPRVSGLALGAMTFGKQGGVGALINRDAERQWSIEGHATRTKEQSRSGRADGARQPLSGLDPDGRV
jgi:aryl-alcohol dehydrogenase-like predicted oxidoreductase